MSQRGRLRRWQDNGLHPRYHGQADAVTYGYDASNNLSTLAETTNGVTSTKSYTYDRDNRVTAVIADGVIRTYTYDANGMRTGRTNGTDTYTYTYNGSQLSKMTKDSSTLYFTYDGQGDPLTVRCDGDVYYYVTNIQGDVIGLIDAGGNTVAEYIYDAWGNILSITGSKAQGVGAANPLRYRGYVYDTETGLYYVSSRYYDPEIGRWINADAAIGQIGNVQGTNMFAYCFNNPVNMSDPTGNWPKLSTIFTVVAVEEWKLHNFAYNLGYKRERTGDCDFNNADEGMGIWDFAGR